MNGPVASLEYRRIADLPRRVWDRAEDLDELVDGLTEIYRTPEGTMRLKRTQAAALRDIYDHGGLFGPIMVGGGKTLVTLLAPGLLGAATPVLLVPASVRDQTVMYVIPEMKKHWKLHPNLRVVGYEEISLEKNAGLLDELKPDLLLLDECDMLKRLQAGRTRRVARYMRENPYTTVVALSGTVANHSILHYWHIVQWALKPDNSPVPRGWHEAHDWANAIDERVKDEDRLPPGILGDTITSARRWYRDRLVQTPGVVATDEGELGVSLQLDGIWDIPVPLEVRVLMKQVAEAWETPWGTPIMEAVERWRILRELSCGFYYEWQPKPPRDWLAARKEWAAFVRYTLQHNRRRLDTPLQVWNAHPKERAAWEAIKDTYVPNVVPIWVSRYLVDYATQWLSDYEGVCWVEHQCVGKELERYGFPYYGAGDSRILEARGSCIASIAAHGTGKNLQQWNHNLVICPPTAGKTWEQMMGRTHRMGQLEDRVFFDVPLHTEPFQNAMSQAFADARFLQDSLGNRQRLLYCDTNIR